MAHHRPVTAPHTATTHHHPDTKTCLLQVPVLRCQLGEPPKVPHLEDAGEVRRQVEGQLRLGSRCLQLVKLPDRLFACVAEVAGVTRQGSSVAARAWGQVCVDSIEQHTVHEQHRDI